MYVLVPLSRIMSVNAKMIPVKTVPGVRGGSMKERWRE
jgi:hypothetical protein